MLILAGLLVLPGPDLAQAHEYEIGTLEIVHPWSRATLPGAKVAVGYMTLKNAGSETDRLQSASSGLGSKVEIHQMSVDDQGVMTMRPVPDGIDLPPGSTVELSPGSFHLMFMDIREPAVQGTKFKATLTFEKAGAVDVEFAVEAATDGEDHHSH